MALHVSTGLFVKKKKIFKQGKHVPGIEGAVKIGKPKRYRYCFVGKLIHCLLT